jgi:hypothetical protein
VHISVARTTKSATAFMGHQHVSRPARVVAATSHVPSSCGTPREFCFAGQFQQRLFPRDHLLHECAAIDPTDVLFS